MVFVALCISFIKSPVLSPFRAFGVTQNSKYLPSINLVCASTAGKLWKTTAEMGTKNHCKYIDTVFHGPYFFGRGGKIIKFTYTLRIKNTKATRIKVWVTKGKLKATTLCENPCPPIIKGSQPKTAIIMLAVAQLKLVSVYW